MNTWVLKQKPATWDHCKVFSSDRAFKVPLHRRFIWVVDGRSPGCVPLCWTQGKGSIAVPRASAPICYRLGQRCRRGAWRCWCIPGLPRSIQCSAHTSRRVFTSSEQYAKLLFFSGLFCFESQNAPISKFPRQTEGTDINECARLSGSNRPPFQHVSFKGMTHAQFAISKILLFVSTVITLPNRKCNAAPPEDKSNWWFLGRLLTALVFVGHVEQCCL